MLNPIYYDAPDDSAFGSPCGESKPKPVLPPIKIDDGRDDGREGAFAFNDNEREVFRARMAYEQDLRALSEEIRQVSECVSEIEQEVKEQEKVDDESLRRILNNEKRLDVLAVRLETFVTYEAVRTMLEPQQSEIRQLREQIARQEVTLTNLQHDITSLSTGQASMIELMHVSNTALNQMSVSLEKFGALSRSEIDRVRRDFDMTFVNNELEKEREKNAKSREREERRSFRGAVKWFSDNGYSIAKIAGGFTVVMASVSWLFHTAFFQWLFRLVADLFRVAH